ncbi:hypothetical protein Tco_1524474 [Tanacetum coccineum]
MADLKFVDQHNMVAYLEKSDENAEFHQIVDFLSTCSINYALTVSPTIYASYIEQFWNTATSKIINSVKQIHAIVDGKAVVISESSVRSDLLFNDEDGVAGPRRQKPNGSPAQNYLREYLNSLMNHLYQKVTHLEVGRAVLDLEKEKDAQTVKILNLKRRVKKLERKRKSSISHPRRRKYRQVETSSDDGLDEEDASKQGRRSDKLKPMFNDKDFEELDDYIENVEEETVDAATTRVSTVSALTLIKMKEQKAKEKGVAITDVEDSSRIVRPVRSITTLQPLPTIDPKDKGKGVLVEEEPVKIKMRDQGDLQVQADVELAQRLHEEELVEIDANHELAVRLTHEEQKKYIIEERARLLAEFFNQRKKQLAAARAEAIRNKPPTKIQVRNMMITYFKYMGKYTHQQLKNKTYEEIQRLYEKEKRWIDDFQPMDTEAIKDSEKIKGCVEFELVWVSCQPQWVRSGCGLATKGVVGWLPPQPGCLVWLRDSRVVGFGSGQPGQGLSGVLQKKVDSSSNQLGEVERKYLPEKEQSDEEAAADYEHEKEELRMWLTVVLDEEETVDPKILSAKYPIVDWESQNLRNVDMEDLHVMKRFEDTTPEGYNLLLWEDLKLEAEAERTMAFELLKFIKSQLEE